MKKVFLLLGRTSATALITLHASAYAQPTSYTDVEFGKDVYHLPVNEYRMWVQPYNKARDHAAFGFNAIAPDVAPATSDPEEAATWGKGTGWHKHILILVEYGSSFISQQKQLDNAFSDSHRMKKLQDTDENSGKPVARFKYLIPENYTTLADGCKKFEGYSIGGNQTQVCTDEGDLLVIHCHPETGIPLAGGTVSKLSPYCNVMINIGEKTQLTYSYSYDYFDRALELHHKLVALLRSFRVPLEQP